MCNFCFTAGDCRGDSHRHCKWIRVQSLKSRLFESVTHNNLFICWWWFREKTLSTFCNDNTAPKASGVTVQKYHPPKSSHNWFSITLHHYCHHPGQTIKLLLMNIYDLFQMTRFHLSFVIVKKPKMGLGFYFSKRGLHLSDLDRKGLISFLTIQPLFCCWWLTADHGPKKLPRPPRGLALLQGSTGGRRCKFRCI